MHIFGAARWNIRRKRETPEAAARRELYEETGYISSSEIVSLGCLNPDSGRLENKLWCFFYQILNVIRIGLKELTPCFRIKRSEETCNEK